MLTHYINKVWYRIFDCSMQPDMHFSCSQMNASTNIRKETLLDLFLMGSYGFWSMVQVKADFQLYIPAILVLQ